MADTAMKLAAEIIKNPGLLSQYQGRYLIVMDQAVTYPRFDNLNLAICIAAEQGWRAINTCILSAPVGIKASMMYILMEKASPLEKSEEYKRFADVLEKLEQRLAPIEAKPQTANTRSCPKCGAPMLIKTATNGDHIGKQFYVCSDYSKCQTAEPIS